MGLMDRLNQAKCATGIHAGDWQWVEEGNCGQTRTCTRCGKNGTRVSHNVTQWAFTGDQNEPCLMERHCERCLDSETQVKHALEFKYRRELGLALVNDHCIGQYVCARCGYTDGKGVQQHLWGDMYKPEGATRYQRDCLRCDRVDKSAV